jgi:hypothetical protein
MQAAWKLNPRRGSQLAEEGCGGVVGSEDDAGDGISVRWLNHTPLLIDQRHAEAGRA